MKYPFYAFDNVELENGFESIDSTYGTAITIEDQLALEREITKTLVFKSDGLNGNQIRAIRRFLQKTQEELASTIGVTRLTIVRWEGGETSPSIPEAFSIRFCAARVWLDSETVSRLSVANATAFPNTLHFRWSGSKWVSREFPQISGIYRGANIASGSVTPTQPYASTLRRFIGSRNETHTDPHPPSKLWGSTLSNDEISFTIDMLQQFDEGSFLTHERNVLITTGPTH